MFKSVEEYEADARRTWCGRRRDTSYLPHGVIHREAPYGFRRCAEVLVETLVILNRPRPVDVATAVDFGIDEHKSSSAAGDSYSPSSSSSWHADGREPTAACPLAQAYRFAVRHDMVTVDELDTALVEGLLGRMLDSCRRAGRTREMRAVRDAGGVRTAWDGVLDVSQEVVVELQGPDGKFRPSRLRQLHGMTKTRGCPGALKVFTDAPLFSVQPMLALTRVSSPKQVTVVESELSFRAWMAVAAADAGHRPKPAAASPPTQRASEKSRGHARCANRKKNGVLGWKNRAETGGGGYAEVKRRCGMCMAEDCHARCGGCGRVWYCSRSCQVAHWRFHMNTCKRG